MTPSHHQVTGITAIHLQECLRFLFLWFFRKITPIWACHEFQSIPVVGSTKSNIYSSFYLQIAWSSKKNLLLAILCVKVSHPKYSLLVCIQVIGKRCLEHSSASTSTLIFCFFWNTESICFPLDLCFWNWHCRGDNEYDRIEI